MTDDSNKPAKKPRRQIRVSDEVYVEIQKLAKPLADTPDSVLRRVFSIPEEQK